MSEEKKKQPAAPEKEKKPKADAAAAPVAGAKEAKEQTKAPPKPENVISPEAYDGLEKVASAIDKISNPVRLEGHTDSRPIHTARFHNNWELSAARGIAMLDLSSTHVTDVTPLRLVPVIVTEVPPAVGPVFGEIVPMVGAAT